MGGIEFIEGLWVPLIIWEVHVSCSPYHPPQLEHLPLRNFPRFQIYCSVCYWMALKVGLCDPMK